MITFHIITIFPEMFDSYLNESILKRAIKNKKIAIKLYNPRDFTDDKHRTVDDRPYGGGPGMVMKVEPILKAVENAKGRKSAKIILLSPRGKKFKNTEAQKLSKQKNVVLISGRYEGIDARVKKILKAEEVSIGDYIVTGGELPAMVIIDSVTRRLKGVLGKDESVEERRTSSKEVYTRPEVLEHKGKKYRVPKTLLSGHHKNIESWRKKR